MSFFLIGIPFFCLITRRNIDTKSPEIDSKKLHLKVTKFGTNHSLLFSFNVLHDPHHFAADFFATTHVNSTVFRCFI